MRDVFAAAISRLMPNRRLREKLLDKLQFGLRKSWRRGREEAGLCFKHNLSVCAIAKDEGCYFREWLEFHRLVGVTKFYIYDNESSDNTREILEPYIRAGIVEYTYWPGPQQQELAYAACLKKHAYDTRWLAYIDLDEFIVPVETRTISDFLNTLAPDVSQLIIAWIVYGSDGHETKPDGLVSQNYMRRMPDGFHYNTKAIVKPRMIARADVHYHRAVISGKTVNENGTNISSRKAFKRNLSYSKIRINHYICKSWEEYKNRRLTGRYKNLCDDEVARRYHREHFEANDFRDVYDPVMEQYAAPLNAALARTESGKKTFRGNLMGMLHIEIDEAIKAKATQTLADSGLSLTGAISRYIQELAEAGGVLPPDYGPNNETATGGGNGCKLDA